MDTSLEVIHDVDWNTVQLSGYINAGSKVTASKTPPAAIQIAGLDPATNAWVPVTVRKDGYFNLFGLDLVHINIKYVLDSVEPV